jgi:four helix bundle protein
MEKKTYKTLTVWQRAIELTVKIYKVTEKLPKTEQYGLISQMQRASVSVPSNIAEGYGRKSRNEFHHFLKISFGSCTELETQIEIIKRLGLAKDFDFSRADNLLSEVMQMLNYIIYKPRKTV